MTFAKKLIWSLLFIRYCCATWHTATVLRNTEAEVMFLTKFLTSSIFCYSYAVLPVTYTPLQVPGDPQKWLRPASQISFLQEGTENCVQEGTENCDRMVSCPVVYCDVPELKSRAGGRLFCLKSSMVFLSSSAKFQMIPWIIPCVPSSTSFPVHYSLRLCHSTLYNHSTWNGVRWTGNETVSK